MVPCTCVAPACTAAMVLATATSASLWQWMPMPQSTDFATALTVANTSTGSVPPFVSQSTTYSAPASAAARIHCSEYSGFAT